MLLRKYQLNLYPIGRGSKKFAHEHSHLLSDREVQLAEVHVGMQLRFDYGTEEFDFTPDEDGGSPIYATITHIEAFMDNKTNSRQNTKMLPSGVTDNAPIRPPRG